MQPHPDKGWLRIVVATFYVILPLTLIAAGWAMPSPEPYVIPEVPIPYQPIELEYPVSHPSPEVIVEQHPLSRTSLVTATPIEASLQPVLVSEPEAEPEPEPVEEAVAESESSQSPAPEPEPTSHSSGVEQWRGLVAAYFSSGKVETAMCIMHYESRGDPGATNPSSGAAGLFQFIPSTWNDMVPDEMAGDVYDPETNVRAAAWLQGAAGWSQWSPYNRGLC